MQAFLVSDRLSAYSHLPLEQRQLCWTHLIPDLATTPNGRVPAVRSAGSSYSLDLQQQLFGHWHQWKEGLLAWSELQHRCQPIRRTFDATLQRVVDLGCERGEHTPWAQTVRTCLQVVQRQQALRTFLETPGIEPTNNPAIDVVFFAGVRALRSSVIHRKISNGVQSRRGAICLSRLLTVTNTLSQKGRDVWGFLEQAWIAHHRGGVMPSLLPDP